MLVLMSVDVNIMLCLSLYGAYMHVSTYIIHLQVCERVKGVTSS